MRSHLMTKIAATTLIAALLAGCGGSDNSTTTTTTSGDSAPTVSAGSDQTVAETSSVQLAATASDADGDAISYSWAQTSGTSVNLSSSTISNPTFTAPDVDANEALVFTLTVTAGGVSVSDTVSITVTDASLPAYAAQFESESLTGDPELVSCTVGGTSTTCVSVTLKSSPGGSYTVGPFCPRLTTDSADEGGIWIQSTGTSVADVDGAYITNLSTIYDSSWRMFDPNTNEVFYTENAGECQLAANP